jgi:hypothetical protein
MIYSDDPGSTEARITSSPSTGLPAHGN